MKLNAAIKMADKIALEKPDDFHVYVFPDPYTPGRFAVVQEDDPAMSIMRNAKYCMHGRGARMEQATSEAPQ